MKRPSVRNGLAQALRATPLHEGVLVDSVDVTIPESLFYWRKGFHEPTRDHELNFKRAEFKIGRRGHDESASLSLLFCTEKGISLFPGDGEGIVLQVPTEDGAEAVIALVSILAPFELRITTLVGCMPLELPSES